ncbi:MAG: glutamate-1-semialdehyde 2,1-aminomutase [candidate division NC10 bacterium]|nr:glutamate-1-semialdehyde 2,1-aminomutase [candidate division NC10 bacterium]
MMRTRSLDRSRQMYERALKSLVGGVGGNARGPEWGWRPHPVFMARGTGPRLWDVDGNAYIDYLAAYGPMILGHRPPKVIAAVREVMETMGSMLGTGHALELEAAERVVAAVPCYELVRFANTGSEAVQAALRVARTYTGREKILRFEGQFHGMAEVIHWSAKPRLELAGPREAPHPVAGSTGVPKVLGDTLLIRPWNDPEILRRTIAEHGPELAAVITEPVMANCGVIPPRPGYLEELRELTARHGIVLIFDEVKTGFRLARGGAQEYFRIMPDLAVTAKAIAAGFPLAAVGGRKELMEVISLHRVAQSATYHTNPVAMAACTAAMDEIAAPGFYTRLFQTSEALCDGLRRAGAEAGVPITLQGVGPIFQVHFADRPLWEYRDMVQHARADRYTIFWQAMFERGVLFNSHYQECWFVSAVHGETEVAETVAAAREAFAAVRKAGL